MYVVVSSTVDETMYVVSIYTSTVYIYLFEPDEPVPEPEGREGTTPHTPYIINKKKKKKRGVPLKSFFLGPCMYICTYSK